MNRLPYFLQVRRVADPQSRYAGSVPPGKNDDGLRFYPVDDLSRIGSEKPRAFGNEENQSIRTLQCHPDRHGRIAGQINDKSVIPQKPIQIFYEERIGRTDENSGHGDYTANHVPQDASVFYYLITEG